MEMRVRLGLFYKVGIFYKKKKTQRTPEGEIDKLTLNFHTKRISSGHSHIYILKFTKRLEEKNN